MTHHECPELPLADRMVADLALPEQIVIWSLRRYAAGHGRAEDLAPMFRRIFGLALVEEALTAFASIMATLAQHARRPLLLGRLGAARLAPDEVCLLRLLAAQQSNDLDTAMATTRWLVAVNAGETLLDAAERFARSLIVAEQVLPQERSSIAALQPTRGKTAADIGHAHAIEEIGDLDGSELLVLRGIRLWVGRFKDREEPWEHLDLFFAGEGIAATAPSLHAILYNTSVAATRSVDVRCPHCPSLSPDEARMLHAVACAQRDELQPAYDMLATWLPAAAVRLTVDAVDGLASALTEAGHRLPLRDWRFSELPARRTADLPTGMHDRRVH